MVKCLIFSNLVVRYNTKFMKEISEALDQYTGICKEAIIDSAAKLSKSFEKVIIEVILLYMVIPGRINFTQLGKYGRHGEQCYRQNFGRLRSKSLNWLRFNVSLALRYFGSDGRKARAIDPSYISKSGKKTPHIGRFWSGCAGAVKHGLEIMGLGLIDIDSHNCMLLRAHQTPGNFELKKRNMTLADHYIAVIKRYRKELLKLSHLVVADAFFSTRTFYKGIQQHGFHLVSRFRDNAHLCYLYEGERTGKRGRPKMIDGKIDLKKLDCAFNASFASLNVAKVMMKERGMGYSMSNFKLLMTNTFLTKRIFDVSRYRPNQTLINHIFKELFGCAA